MLSAFTSIPNYFREKLHGYNASELQTMSGDLLDALGKCRGDDIEEATLDKNMMGIWREILAAAEKDLTSASNNPLPYRDFLGKTFSALQRVPELFKDLESAKAVKTLMFAHEGLEASLKLAQKGSEKKKEDLSSTDSQIDVSRLASPFSTQPADDSKVEGYTENELQQMSNTILEKLSDIKGKIKKKQIDASIIAQWQTIIKGTDAILWRLSNSNILLETFLGNAFMGLTRVKQIREDLLPKMQMVRFLIYACEGERLSLIKVSSGDGVQFEMDQSQSLRSNKKDRRVSLRSADSPYSPRNASNNSNANLGNQALLKEVAELKRMVQQLLPKSQSNDDSFVSILDDSELEELTQKQLQEALAIQKKEFIKEIDRIISEMPQSNQNVNQEKNESLPQPEITLQQLKTELESLKVGISAMLPKAPEQIQPDPIKVAIGAIEQTAIERATALNTKLDQMQLTITTAITTQRNQTQQQIGVLNDSISDDGGVLEILRTLQTAQQARSQQQQQRGGSNQQQRRQGEQQRLINQQPQQDPGCCTIS